MTSFELAAGAVGFTHHFAFSPWTGMFADRAAPVWWKNVSIRICERQDRPEPGSLTGRMQ